MSNIRLPNGLILTCYRIDVGEVLIKVWVLRDILPEWAEASDSMQSSQIRLPRPSL